MFKKIRTIFLTSFMVSLTANSGYAIIAAMKNAFVDKNGWLTEEEMSDYTAIAQTTPGPMGISIAAVIGYQTAGTAGALAGVLGCAIPPIAIMAAVFCAYSAIIGNGSVRLFMKGMQFGVNGMLLDVVLGIVSNVTAKRKVYPYIVILLSFLYVRFTDLSVFYLIIALILSVLIELFIGRRKEASK